MLRLIDDVNDNTGFIRSDPNKLIDHQVTYSNRQFKKSHVLNGNQLARYYQRTFLQEYDDIEKLPASCIHCAGISFGYIFLQCPSMNPKIVNGILIQVEGLNVLKKSVPLDLCGQVVTTTMMQYQCLDRNNGFWTKSSSPNDFFHLLGRRGYLHTVTIVSATSSNDLALDWSIEQFSDLGNAFYFVETKDLP
jgi:hypothetical protein